MLLQNIFNFREKKKLFTLSICVKICFIFYRYQPSQGDVSVFKALGKAPAESSVNVLRWYKNIASYSDAERTSWGGQACPLKAGAKTTTAIAPAAKPKEDDDDLDLFGSDDEAEVPFDLFVRFKFHHRKEGIHYFILSLFDASVNQNK